MLRKQRTIRLIIEKKIFWRKRKKEILIQYGGATLYQHLQLSEAKTNEEKLAFFLERVKNNADKKLSGEDEAVLIKNIDKIADQIIATAFTSKKNNRQEKKDFAPYSSYLVYLIQELKIEPRVLMHYTLQEIEYLTEGLVRNLNSKTEEGERKNRLKAQQLQAGEKLEKEKEKIDAFLKS